MTSVDFPGSTAAPPIGAKPLQAAKPPSLKPCKAAFAESLVRDLIRDVDPGVAPETLSAGAEDAWRRRDRSAYISYARAQRTAGCLSAKRALRFARALYDAGLSEEALDVLVDPRLGAESPSFDRAYLQALIWLGLGAPRRAAAAQGQAAALAETSRQCDQAQDLARALDAGARARLQGAWADLCAEARFLVEFGLPEQACDVLRAGFEGGRAEASSSLDEILETAFAAFRRARPGAVAALVGAMAPLYLAAGEGAAWRSAMAALQGAADGGPVPSPGGGLISQKLHACLAAALAANGLWSGAVRRYLAPPRPSGLMGQVLCELARCVGRDTTSGLDLAFQPPAPRPRVFDLFPFNGEFAMLELKLAEMADWVDAFVIVEARRTFTGLEKPLRFPERAGEFEAFRDKIVYLPLDDFPPHVASAWAREFFQRDQAVQGLKGRCSPDDIVILSDADEIIRREAIAGFAGPLAGADLETFKYFLNYEHLSPLPIIKAVFARAGLLARNGSSYLRIGGAQHYGHSYVAKAGWHFTHIAAPEALETKFRSFSHEEWGHLDRGYFEELIGKIRSGGLGPEFRRRAPEELPACIRARQAELADWLL